MSSIGATIRIGAGGYTLEMGGHTWDLSVLTRSQLGSLGGLLSDTMRLHPKRDRRNRNVHKKGQSQA